MTPKESLLRDAMIAGLIITPISVVVAATSGVVLALGPAFGIDAFVVAFYIVWAIRSMSLTGNVLPYRGRWLGDRRDSPPYACRPYLVIGPGFHERLAQRGKFPTSNVATLERDAGVASTYSEGQIRYLTDCYVRSELDLATFERRVEAALVSGDRPQIRGPIGATGATGPTGPTRAAGPTGPV